MSPRPAKKTPKLQLEFVLPEREWVSVNDAAKWREIAENRQISLEAYKMLYRETEAALGDAKKPGPIARWAGHAGTGLLYALYSVGYAAIAAAVVGSLLGIVCLFSSGHYVLASAAIFAAVVFGGTIVAAIEDGDA